MWKTHLWNLLYRSLWDTIVLGGSTLAGIVVIGIIGCILGFILTVLIEWCRAAWQMRALKSAMRSWPPYVGAVGGIVLAWIILFSWSLCATIYNDHEDLVAASSKLQEENRSLQLPAAATPEPAPIKSETPANARPKPPIAPQKQPEPQVPAEKRLTPDSSRGSLVQSNSGGLNVQQGTTGDKSPIINSPITIGNVPKDISPQDVISLTKYFSNAPIKARVIVSADQFSGNTPFPDKFYDALKDGGWPMLEAGVNRVMGFGPPGKKFQGAVLMVRGEPLKSTIYTDVSDPLTYIGNALVTFKIQRILRRVPDYPEGQIMIDFEGGFPD